MSAKKSKSAMESEIGKNIMDSTRNIWLAGLGAFAKTQEEGGKLFESLVKDGARIEAKSKKKAEHKADDLRDKVGETKARVLGGWDKLEHTFQERVAKALERIGVPTNDEVRELSRRVEELNANLQELVKTKKEAN